MSTLLSLPAEILQDIIRELPASSIFSFCQTCKAALDFSEPLLYCTIRWQFYGETDEDDVSEPPLEHPIHSFMSAISRRPVLASHVKTAELLSGTDSWGWRDPLPNYPPPPDTRDLWLDCLGRRSLPRNMRPGFEAEVTDGVPATLMGLLLATLPALETLVTDYTMMQNSSLPGAIFESNTLRLRKIIIRNNLDSRVIKPSETPWLQTVFCIPSLEHLSTILPRVEENQISGANLPVLRTLKLVDHQSEPDAISTLLSRAPKLESLTYFLVEDTDDLAADENYEQSHENEWAAFAKALTRVAGSLRTLKISIDEAATSDYPPDTMDEEWMMGVTKRRGRIPSLRQLTNLTKLEIPMYLLLGFSPERVQLKDVLPLSLRKLYFRDDHVYDDDLVDGTPEKLISALESYFFDRSLTETPPLQELRIKLRGRGMQDRFDRACIEAVVELGESPYLRTLEKLGRRSGVKVTVHQRKDTYISAEQDVIDEADELVLYDPRFDGSTEETDGREQETTGYPTRCRLNRARVFYSNI
jgi:hypothetical protein